MGGFNNPEIASEAGKKSKRGENKYNIEVKEMIKNLVEQLYTDVIDNLHDLSTRDKAFLLSKLVEFQTPKVRHTMLDIGNQEPTKIVFQNVSKNYEIDENGVFTKIQD